MARGFLTASLVTILCFPILSFGQGAMQSVPANAARIQVMQMDDVLRAKVAHQDENKGTGTGTARTRDEGELEKAGAEAAGVKFLPAGQAGKLPQGQ